MSPFEIMSKGFLCVSVTLTASTEQFENSILSNLAFSVESCEMYSEHALFASSKNSLGIQGPVAGFGTVQTFYRHLDLPLFHAPVARLPFPEVFRDLSIELVGVSVVHPSTNCGQPSLQPRPFFISPC